MTAHESHDADRRRALQSLAGWSLLGALAISACSNEAPAKLRPGDQFPRFVLADIDGRTHDSRSYEGRPLLLNVWATWCPPCRNEMADLNFLQQALAPKGMVLLTISIDRDLNLVREFVRREGLTLTVLFDANQQWSRSALGIPALPASYLIGSDFKVKEIVAGARRWADAQVQDAVATRLNLQP